MVLDTGLGIAEAGTIAQNAPATKVASGTREGRFFDPARLRHAASNLGLAALFFLALRPGVAHYGSGIADWVWTIGAFLMGILSLVRVPPITSTITLSSILSTAAMMYTPTLISSSTAASTGLFQGCAITIELFGVVVGQVSRLYLGRSFGLLPANRGIVSSGPFRIIRHPVYVGWFILASGYAMAYPSWRNAIAIALTLPFMMWRITLEERLLTKDPEYRAYCEKTRYRLIPGLY